MCVRRPSVCTFEPACYLRSEYLKGAGAGGSVCTFDPSLYKERSSSEWFEWCEWFEWFRSVIQGIQIFIIFFGVEYNFLKLLKLLKPLTTIDNHQWGMRVATTEWFFGLCIYVSIHIPSHVRASKTIRQKQGGGSKTIWVVM